MKAINEHSSAVTSSEATPIQIHAPAAAATATDEFLMQQMANVHHTGSRSHVLLPMDPGRNPIRRAVTGPRNYVEKSSPTTTSKNNSSPSSSTPILISHISPRDSSSSSSPISHISHISPREEDSFQQIKVKKKMLFAKTKKKDGVLFCKRNNLPAILSEPDRHFVGCSPCQGTLLKRKGIFWTPHEFEVWSWPCCVNERSLVAPNINGTGT